MGYGPDGKGDPDAIRWQKRLPLLQEEAGVRFGKFKFKTKGKQPHPDELKITLTGNAMPETFKRLALWSAQRHGFKV